MILELFEMNGYGLYVWSSFIFTLLSFIILFFVIEYQLKKEKRKFKKKFESLNFEEAKLAKIKTANKEILANSFI
tara:strand:+ start:67 stop:291 length:225 start_codon:yes stop_codon:yes gene_type:complete